jgi:hypothetical protein
MIVLHAASADATLSKTIAAVMRIASELANARQALISAGLSKNLKKSKVAVRKNESPAARLWVKSRRRAV